MSTILVILDFNNIFGKNKGKLQITKLAKYLGKSGREKIDTVNVKGVDMFKYEEKMIEQAKKEIESELNIKFTNIDEDKIGEYDVEKAIFGILSTNIFNGRYFNTGENIYGIQSIFGGCKIGDIEFSKTFNEFHTVAKIPMSDEEEHIFIKRDLNDDNIIKSWTVS